MARESHLDQKTGERAMTNRFLVLLTFLSICDGAHCTGRTLAPVSSDRGWQVALIEAEQLPVTDIPGAYLNCPIAKSPSAVMVPSTVRKIIATWE